MKCKRKFWMGFAGLIILIFANFSYAYEKEIKDLSTTMAEDIGKAAKKRIAVVDFTDLQGNVTELGRFLAEEFSVALAGAGKGFEVVDRTHLKTILAEHKLSATGIIDPQTAKKLGQIAGVDALITGTITPFGDSVRLSVKILDTTTAKVIGASSGNIAKTKAIEELLAKGIETGTTTAPGTGTPSSPPQLKAMPKAEVMNYIFEARGCKASGGIIICIVVITNKTDMERVLTVTADNMYRAMWGTPPTYLYDEAGNEYEAKNVEGKGILEQKGLMPDVPINVRFSFEQAAISQSKGMTLIVSCYDHKTAKAFRVTLKNIPLTR